MAHFEIETDRGIFRYDTDPCSLTGPDGNPVDLSRFGYRYFDAPALDNDAPAFSHDDPIVGKEQPRILKIQLGLGCNYSCSYCSQGGQKEEKTSAADARAFVDHIEDWLEEAPEKIEFWGGEPTLYWHKLEELAPALRCIYPKVRMSMVTNGSLLTYERALWLHDLGFSLAVSHDGPGHALRGEDPLESEEWTETMRAIFKLFGERICFNVVITPLNYRLLDTVLWFEKRMGFEVKINVEDVVTDYGGARWKRHELEDMAAEMRKAIGTGLGLFFPRLRWSVQQFMESLAIAKPLTGSHQVCGMDRRDQLAVDLSGNVLTCQNAGAESGHKIGRVEDLAGVTLNTAKSWAVRSNCHECPVVHLCYGTCMFLDGREFSSSCEASYYYNTAIVAGIIKLLTGAEVRSISGWKPARMSFPIPVVAG